MIGVYKTARFILYTLLQNHLEIFVQEIGEQYGVCSIENLRINTRNLITFQSCIDYSLSCKNREVGAL